MDSDGFLPPALPDPNKRRGNIKVEKKRGICRTSRKKGRFRRRRKADGVKRFGQHRKNVGIMRDRKEKEKEESAANPQMIDASKDGQGADV